MEFAQKLKELRKENNFTAKDIALKVSCSTNLIYDWEHGRCEPSYLVLSQLADMFNVSVDYLIGREDDFGNINVASQLTDQLTADERELLSCFNATDFAGREALLISARALAGKKEKLKER